MACDKCHRVLLIPFLGEPSLTEYFEKVEMHVCAPNSQDNYEERMSRWIVEWYDRKEPKSNLHDYLGWSLPQLRYWEITGAFPMTKEGN